MDDVVAGHFVTGPNGEPWRSESMPVCIARKVEMNKALNHLTFTRSTRKPLWGWSVSGGRWTQRTISF